MIVAVTTDRLSNILNVANIQKFRERERERGRGGGVEGEKERRWVGLRL